MKKIKISILSLLLTVASIQTGYASSWEGLPTEVKEYMLKMDNLTFKQLRDLALVNKESRAQVVKYFKERLDRLKNTACPVLNQEVLDQIQKTQKKGLPSFFETARDPGYQSTIVVLKDNQGNEIKWDTVGGTLRPDYPNFVGKEAEQPFFGRVNISSSKPLGPIVAKRCVYYAQYHSIILSIYDEFLVLAEVPLP
jgi:hypothetical protein